MSEQKKPRPKTRGNGMGCAYQRPGEKTWTVEVVVGWRHVDGDPSKPRRPVRRKKGGFPTKRAALEYASTLRIDGNKRVRMTLEEVWFAWKSSYENRVDASTMACYLSAYKHFSSLHGTYMDQIAAENLQSCMDNCPAGKRTHQNMRTIAGLLWRYAIEKDIIDRDITRNLYTGKGKSVQREALTKAEEETILSAIGTERYAEYIYCLIWLGYRPGEFLELRKDQLFCANIADSPSDAPVYVWYFVNGKKTDAGRDRIVAIPEKVLPYILDRLFIPGTPFIFPRYVFTHAKKDKQPELIALKPMTDFYFRESVFKPMMARLHIAEGKVPYAARHSFANKLKRADGTDGDKARLIGHTDYAFTQSAYQSSNLADLKKLVDSL